MARATKASPRQWATYLTLYQSVNTLLQNTDWFCDGWETEFRFVDQDSPRVIFLLRKLHWCNGSIHFKTRLTNTDLSNKTTRVGLHVETNFQEHDINRITFDKLLLMWGSKLIQSWGGYIIKPTHFQKPIHIYVPFTSETLVSSLYNEFTKLQNLAPIIDRAITEAKASAA